MLLENIKKDLQNEMKSKEPSRRDNLKVIVAEFQRSKNKDISDNEVLTILKTLENNELERLAAVGHVASEFLSLIREYLPKPVTKEEILSWIKENVDSSKFPNKSPIIGIVKRNFGVAVDGATVREIVDSF